MKAEVYVLGLFTFKDEDKKNIVFTNEQLIKINDKIEVNIKAENRIQMSKWVTYQLKKQEIMSLFASLTCTVTEAEMGYYHHRVIFRFIIEGKNIQMDLRNIREKLNIFAKKKIDSAIVKPNRNLGFKRCDIYQLTIIHKGLPFLFKKEDSTFSEDTTTMAFDINEPRKFSPISRKYNIRISIPSTIISTRSGVSNDFKKAMINSIYQYCLYEKKKISKAGSEIDERQLVHLWNHIIDTMGGRTLDKNIAKVSQTNYLLALIAAVFAIVAFDNQKSLENVSFFFSKISNFINFFSSLFH